MHIIKKGSFTFHNCNKEQIAYLKKVCTHYDFEKEKFFKNYIYKNKVFQAPLYNPKVLSIVNKNKYEDLIEANKAINLLKQALAPKTTKGSITGSGSVGARKARIELLKGEINAGNTNKYLKLELRHLLRNKKK